MQLGLSTSIVEIDRAVYDAARDYFGLPEPAAAYIEDGRGWMVRQASMRNGTYDIIIHDCFSGGGVPSHLFTMEFWASAKQVLDPEGIVAVVRSSIASSCQENDSNVLDIRILRVSSEIALPKLFF